MSQPITAPLPDPGAPWPEPPIPVAEVLDCGRGLVLHPDRLPALRHRKAELVACAETVRRRFVAAWVQHLAEVRYPHAQAERLAGRLGRILAVVDAVAWLSWRHGPGLGPRCPLTDAWFEELGGPE